MQVIATMEMNMVKLKLLCMCSLLLSSYLNLCLLFWLVGHHHDHIHDSAVSSVSIVSEGVLDLDEVILTKG
jgi:hypothetical protein